MPAAPSVSLIVLNWNGRAMLDDCLASLAPQLGDAELIVVDNGSHDGSARFVRERWPAARLLALPRNRGFSGGVNAGLAVARGEYLVLLNNDATADPGFVDRIVAPLRTDQALGACAGVMTFAHRPDLVASAGIRFHRDGVALDDRMLQPLAALPAAPAPVWGASGGAVAYRRAALADVGLFDEGYFAYLEDVDLSWRLRLRGWAIALAPGARARHVYSATGGEGSPFKNWLLARNRWRVILRCLPTAALLRDWPRILAYDALACAQTAARLPFHGRPTTITGRLAAWRDAPRLLEQRRQIQARRRADDAEVDAWLLPARPPWQIWREARALGAVLRQRDDR